MSVTDVVQDPEALTLTLTAHFEASIDAVWTMWADPRKLERWWGPPLYPATFTDHDLRPQGRMRYYMTGPEGEKFHGWWEVQSVEAPNGLTFVDGFADDAGNPNDEMPQTRAAVRITDAGDGRTMMQITSAFPSLTAMEEMAALGMVEGFTDAINQLDALLAE